MSSKYYRTREKILLLQDGGFSTNFLLSIISFCSKRFLSFFQLCLVEDQSKKFRSFWVCAPPKEKERQTKVERILYDEIPRDNGKTVKCWQIEKGEWRKEEFFLNQQLRQIYVPNYQFKDTKMQITKTMFSRNLNQSEI